MDDHRPAPRFGGADLSNCERELIHLAGSIQPHGALLVLREPELTVLQASRNLEGYLGRGADRLLGKPLGEHYPELGRAIRSAASSPMEDIRRAVRLEASGDGGSRPYLAHMHRHPTQGLILELERLDDLPAVEQPRRLLDETTEALSRIGSAPAVESLADDVVKTVRSLTGYDRVMVYSFDRDGHGEVKAEAREQGLESYLGLHYPASDIPQRARSLYVRNRLRLLVDVDYSPVPVTPRRSPVTGEDLDMSLCYLRSMSPIHVQYLENMGVTATMVTSLVTEGELWGLIACHHYSPKNLAYERRAVCELISEVASTRITALESMARAYAQLRVRRLEAQLIESTTRQGGDWKRALLQDSETLLEPLDATGAALFFEGEISTVGDVAATPGLRRLRRAVGRESDGPVFRTDALARDLPELSDLAPTITGVLGVRLSESDDEFLMWFRPEQLQTVHWGGDPRKAVIVGEDPSDLSPRRSFAVWTELVRDSSRPWTESEVTLAATLGESLRDVITQVRAMRLLLSERETSRIRRRLQDASPPVLVASSDGRILFESESFAQIFTPPHAHLETLEDLPGIFANPARVRGAIEELRDGRPWKGELRIERRAGDDLPVAVRMDPIPSRSGPPTGYVVLISDLTESKQAEEARRDLYETLEHRLFPDEETADGAPSVEDVRETLGSVLRNLADGMTVAGGTQTPSLKDLATSARRAERVSKELLEYLRER